MTVQPLRAWQIEQGITQIVIDREDQISFFVQIKMGDGENTSNGDLQTLFPILILEDEKWSINSFAENFVVPTPQPMAIPTLDPGSVPDRGYYDSIVVIAQYYLLNNHDLHEQAYHLLSPSRRDLQSLEEYLDYYLHYLREVENIDEIKILTIRPLYEGALQFQYVTTPNPATRRKFIAEFNYVKRGNTVTTESNSQSRFITTIFENEAWEIYSINTSP